MGYGYVVGEFGGAEDFAFAEGGGSGKEAFGCVGAVERGGCWLVDGGLWLHREGRMEKGAHSTQRMSSS